MDDLFTGVNSYSSTGTKRPQSLGSVCLYHRWTAVSIYILAAICLLPLDSLLGTIDYFSIVEVTALSLAATTTHSIVVYGVLLKLLTEQL